VNSASALLLPMLLLLLPLLQLRLLETVMI